MKRLKSILIIFLSLNVAIMSYAKSPVEDDIIDMITRADSPYYYPNLLLRFNNGDTTLTIDDYHYLYYGYAYQEAYKPQAINQGMDLVLLRASSLDASNPSRESLEELISAATSALELNPFSPQLWNLMAFAYGGLNQRDKEFEAYDRMNKIISTIDNSGDGFKEKSAKHILMFDHANDLLAAQSINHGRAEVISRQVEYVPFIAPVEMDGRKKKVKGLYFDFSRIYWNKPETLKTNNSERTWQFNNLKPRKY